MSEIKTKIRTYNDVIDLFGEEKAADMLSEALDWSTIDPKNDKKNIMERKPLLLDPYMTYEGEDYCKHIVAGFLGDRDLDWASGYIDEEKIKNGQVMPSDLKSALSMALDNELSTSWAYLDALSSQCAEICNKFAGYIESAGLARGVLVPREYELDHDALNADVSERFNIQYGFQCDQMIDAMQFDMTLILTEKVDSMDGYRLIQSVCDWREENLEVIEDAENNLDYGKVPSYVAYERPADIGTTIIDELCASQGTAVEKLVNYPTTKFERTMRDELFEALAVNETTISLMAKVPSSVFLDAVACMDSRYMSGHTVDTGHAFIVSPGTYEPYIGIHDPVYGAGYMMVDLDKPFEIPMNRIWIAMDDYSGPETKEGLRGMYHSPQDVSAFSDPFSGSVSVTPTRDEKQEPAKSGLEAKRDACALSALISTAQTRKSPMARIWKGNSRLWNTKTSRQQTSWKAGMRRRKISSRVMSAIMPYHSATYTTWIPQATFQKNVGAIPFLLTGNARPSWPCRTVYRPRRSSNIRMSSAGSTAWRCRLSPMITPSAT